VLIYRVKELVAQLWSLLAPSKNPSGLTIKRNSRTWLGKVQKGMSQKEKIFGLVLCWLSL
jgi:hypothetical protein